MTVQLESLKESYYEYIAKIPAGLQTILRLLEQQQYEHVFHSLVNLAEGVEALYLIEQTFVEQGHETNSRLHEAITEMQNINISLERKMYSDLTPAIQSLHTIFESATEWTFSK